MAVKIAISFIALIAIAAGQEIAMTPAFFWANFDAFPSKDAYISEVTEQSDIRQLVKSFSTGEVPHLAHELEHRSRPDVVVGIIVDNSLSISQSEMNALSSTPINSGLVWIRDALNASTSSLVVPETYNNRVMTGEDLVSEIRSEVDPVSPAVVVASIDPGFEASAASLIHGQSGVASVLLVTAGSASGAAEAVKMVQRVLSTASKKAVFFLTAPAPVAAFPDKALPASRRSLLASASVGASAGQAAVRPRVYCTPNVLVGIILGLFLVSMMMIALCCMMQVQGPSLFVKQYPLKGREY